MRTRSKSIVALLMAASVAMGGCTKSRSEEQEKLEFYKEIKHSPLRGGEKAKEPEAGGRDTTGATSQKEKPLPTPHKVRMAAPPKVKISVEVKGVKGGADSAEVHEVMKVHTDQVRRCYFDGVGIRPDTMPSGTVEVRFAFDSTGRVRTCRVVKNMSVEKIGTCLCHRLRTWRFVPNRKGTVEVTAQWSFSPSR